MFMYEDPFAHSNHFYRGLLNLSKNGKTTLVGKAKLFIAKVKRVIQQEGMIGLLKKLKKKIVLQ